MKCNHLYKDVLGNMGYDVESKGAIYFSSLLDDIRKLLDSDISEDEIRKVLPNYYREDQHFFFEVTPEHYYSELNSFCASRKDLSKSKDIPVMGLDDSVIYFAKMFNSSRDFTKGKNKYIKTNTIGIIESVKPQ